MGPPMTGGCLLLGELMMLQDCVKMDVYDPVRNKIWLWTIDCPLHGGCWINAYTFIHDVVKDRSTKAVKPILAYATVATRMVIDE